jgi:hypothetical protein
MSSPYENAICVALRDGLWGSSGLLLWEKAAGRQAAAMQDARSVLFMGGIPNDCRTTSLILLRMRVLLGMGLSTPPPTNALQQRINLLRLGGSRTENDFMTALLENPGRELEIRMADLIGVAPIPARTRSAHGIGSTIRR